MKTPLFAALTAVALMAGPAFAADGHAALNHAPKGFVKVSDALKNPNMAWIPGLGTLYIDPATLSQGGPFLGYDKQGHLTNVTYMISLADLNAHKNFNNLGTSMSGLKIDHTDIVLSHPHPGVMVDHVHVINWLVPHAQEAKTLGAYPLGFEAAGHSGHEGHH
jgi:hypothetical protein